MEKTKILVVDDQYEEIEGLIEILRNEKSVKVQYAESTIEAVEMLKHHNYDVIITDYDIDKYKGITLLELISGNNSKSHDLSSLVKECFKNPKQCRSFSAKNEDALLIMYTSSSDAPENHQLFAEGKAKLFKKKYGSGQIISLLEEERYLTSDINQEESDEEDYDWFNEAWP